MSDLPLRFARFPDSADAVAVCSLDGGRTWIGYVRTPSGYVARAGDAATWDDAFRLAMNAWGGLPRSDDPAEVAGDSEAGERAAASRRAPAHSGGQMEMLL